MRDVLLIARLTVSGILRNKLIYLILILGLLLLVPMILSSFYVQMARTAGEDRMAEAIAISGTVAILGAWTFTGTVLGLFLGASALPSEIKAKTIVAVLTKPLERWRFLTGKWLGVQVFVSSFFAAGLLFAVASLRLFGIPIGGLFGIASAHALLLLLSSSSLAMLLSTVVSPVMAGGLGFVFHSLNLWSAQLLDAAIPWVRWPAKAMHYLSPARLDELLGNFGLSETPMEPEYGLYFAVLGENLLWVLAVEIGACLLFAKREIRIR